jgi:tetratricopeptide (TPR) repeat protein
MIRSRRRISFLGNFLLLLLLAAVLGLLPACRSTARAREHVEKGNQYLAQTQFSSAESEYQQAIQINPDFADAYYRLGLLQIQQEYPTAARQSLAHAVDLDPKNLDARLRLGDLLVSSTQYAEARQQADAVLQQDGKNAGAHRLLGQVALHQMQYVAAENELKQALALDARDPQTYEVLGLAQLLDAEYGAAEKSFQTAVDIKPADPQTYINLANFIRDRTLPIAPNRSCGRELYEIRKRSNYPWRSLASMWNTAAARCETPAGSGGSRREQLPGRPPRRRRLLFG